MMTSAKKSTKEQLHEIIFESHTRAGKAFDITLLIFIVLSVLVVMLDSIRFFHEAYGHIFLILEWGFTIVFTLECLLRLWCLQRPLLYAKSFMGIVDILSIIPTYLSIFLAGTQMLLVLRVLRLLRVFRIFELSSFVGEMRFLGSAIRASIRKISIFMLIVFTLVIILGAVMYLVEQGQNGFNSIPESIYWAIVTITTVGYGDISPVTAFGKLVASVIMLLGYGILAVPTGIITTEMSLAMRKKKEQPQVCPGCGREGHDTDALYCKYCSTKL